MLPPIISSALVLFFLVSQLNFGSKSCQELEIDEDDPYKGFWKLELQLEKKSLGSDPEKMYTAAKNIISLDSGVSDAINVIIGIANAPNGCSDEFMEKVEKAREGTKTRIYYTKSMNPFTNKQKNFLSFPILKRIFAHYVDKSLPDCYARFKQQFIDLQPSLNQTKVEKIYTEFVQDIQELPGVRGFDLKRIIDEFTGKLACDPYRAKHFERHLKYIASGDARLRGYKSMTMIENIYNPKERAAMALEYQETLQEHLGGPCEHLIGIYGNLLDRLKEFLLALSELRSENVVKMFPVELKDTVRVRVECRFVLEAVQKLNELKLKE